MEFKTINMKTSVFTVLLIFPILLFAKEYNISDYGAINDSKTKNTMAIQKTIDVCTSSGGGTVMVDGGGTYVTGTIYLKDNVTLHVANGTTLQGSANYADYTTDTHKMMYTFSTHLDRCLIFAKEVKNISIEGYGTIDGNGYEENFPKGEGRPVLIRLLECENIHFRNINLINPASWTTAILYCNNIEVSGINIHSRVNYNGDGLDFDGCTNVRVTNSNFDNSDDCICLQTSRPDKPCKNVVITNNVFCTQWGGIRIGLLSRANIESVTVSNCVFRDIKDSGLKIQLCEGGEMKNMTFSNLVMENVPRPIFMTFAPQRACVDIPEGEFDPLKRMHGFYFSNIIVDNSQLDKNSAIFLSGLPEHKIEDISIKDVRFIVSGGGTKDDAEKISSVKEFTLDVIEKHWPEFYLTGTLPSFGIYARHLDGLHLENINIHTVHRDERPAIIFDDVSNITYNFLKANSMEIGDNEIVEL